MNETYRKARRHLSRDPVMKAVIQGVGKCTLTPQPDEPLTMLVRAVIAQQISTKAAQTIYGRLLAKLKGPPVLPARLRKLTADDFAACGVSGPKQRAIAAILAHVAAEKDYLKRLPTLDDEALRQAIVQIKGLGPWSADMLLMFGFGRLDVLPVGDLGVKLGIRDLYGLDTVPDVETMLRIGEPWRPYRTVASWYLWRSRDWDGK